MATAWRNGPGDGRSAMMASSKRTAVVAGQVEACLLEMSPEARAEIERMAASLMAGARRMGRKGALELVFKLAVYLASPHCRICGASIEEPKKRICRRCYLLRR